MNAAAGFSSAELQRSLIGLRRYAIRLAGSVSDGEDLLQDTAVKAWRYRASFIDGSLQSWLLVMLRNLYRSSCRAKARRPELQALDFESAAEPFVCGFSKVLAREGITIFEGMRERDRRFLLAAALGDTVEEIAAREGVAPGTVKSRLSRARFKLSSLINGHGRSRNVCQDLASDHAEPEPSLVRDLHVSAPRPIRHHHDGDPTCSASIGDGHFIHRRGS